MCYLKSYLVILLFFISCNFASTQTLVCIEVSQIPNDTPKDAKIYVAGDFNTWNPKDEKYQLKKDSTGYWRVCFITDTPTLGFKFTLGSWESVENNGKGQDISNRILDTSKQKTYQANIQSWNKADYSPQKSTASPQVKVLEDSIYMTQLKRYRTIRIYLPPDYTETKRRYPVLYMHDGQNLFDIATAYNQEWSVDEILDTAFIQNDKNAFIIIGIDNGERERINEYSPWINPEYGGGQGKAYVHFLVKELKPFIDKKFRTQPQAKYTAIMGSSMGGLISFYAGMEYPQVFGKVGIFSPSFWFSDEIISFIKQKNLKKSKSLEWYFLVGERESEGMVGDCKKIYQTLLKGGIPQKKLKMVTKKDGKHQEWFWYREFKPALEWLGFLTENK
jgi:alpha-glucosidase